MPRRVATRLTVLLLGVVGALLVSPGPAGAHPFLLFTTPTANSAITESPTSVETAQLVLDRQGRIAEETLTDPKHLILRRFQYPEPQ